MHHIQKEELLEPYHATLEESNERLAQYFTARSVQLQSEGDEEGAARLRKMVVNAVGETRAHQIAQAHELQLV